MQQIKIHWTAKREHADKILRSIPDGFHCNSRWVYMAHTPIRPVTHWLRENFDDAIASHVVGFYVEAGDDINTSLLEIGNALAYNRRIFIASDRTFEEAPMPHKKLEKWAGFENIKISGSLEQTYSFIRKLFAAQKITRNDGTMEDRR